MPDWQANTAGSEAVPLNDEMDTISAEDLGKGQLMKQQRLCEHGRSCNARTHLEREQLRLSGR
jgi:hypothetical protein